MQSVVPKIDRLVNLVAGMRIDAVGFPPLRGAGLFIIQKGAGFRLVLDPPTTNEDACFAIRINWGMRGDPLANAVAKPGVYVDKSHPLHPVLELVFVELGAPRCGSTALLAGYGEVIIIQMLRDLVKSSVVEMGILGGLADNRLAAALVAMHKSPGQAWNTGDLAALAGMSRSAFMDRFARVMGEGPMSYLRRYRLAESREALAAGQRVGDVARRFGYGSADAFSRAFRQAQGISPSRFSRAADQA